MADSNTLSLSHIVGFNGKLQGGVVALPDGERMMYAVGGSLVVRGLEKDAQQMLLNRSTSTADEICCMAVSRSGRLAASAHKTRAAGSKSDIVVWEMESLCAIHTLSLHVGAVASLSFSPDEKYLVSLGADDNRVAVWDAVAGKAVCGAPASKEREGKARVVAFMPTSKLTFVTSGDSTMRVWEFDEVNKRIEPNEVAMGQAVKRIVTCIVPKLPGDTIYCGTTTGDILEIDVAHRVFKTSGPTDKKDVPIVELGVVSLAISNEFLYVGSGSGILYKVDPASWTVKKRVQLDGSGTSVSRLESGGFVYGSANNKIYYFDADLSSQLLMSAPLASVNDLAFAYDYSDLYVACSANSITVWNSTSAEELLHIEDPNKSLVCHCVVVSKDGRTIISGWSDGRVRAYTPETGKFLYQMENVHRGAVTALALFDSGNGMVTGGVDGEVRLWRMGRESRTLEANMKEHRGPVTSLVLTADHSRCLSSSADGTCLVWDLARHVSVKSFFGGASVQDAVFDKSEARIIAVGAEKRVVTYEVSSGARLSECLAAQLALTCVAIAPGGGNIATGSKDLAVKIWSPDGLLVAVGNGHSGAVTKVRFSPDGSFLVTSGDNGAIYKWTV